MANGELHQNKTDNPVLSYLKHYIRVKNYTIEDVIKIRDKKCND